MTYFRPSQGRISIHQEVSRLLDGRNQGNKYKGANYLILMRDFILNFAGKYCKSLNNSRNLILAIIAQKKCALY